MSNLNRDLLTKVEQALNIHFHEWQIKYILQEPDILDMRITGRATGKTLAYILKTLFESEETLDLSNAKTLIETSDWYCSSSEKPKTVGNYQHWFLEEIRDIYNTLNDAGIKTRKVIFYFHERNHDKDFERIYEKITRPLPRF